MGSSFLSNGFCKNGKAGAEEQEQEQRSRSRSRSRRKQYESITAITFLKND